MNWRFISRRALVLLHDESLAEHGGRPGLRDDGLLAAAVASPHQVLACGQPDVAELAAAYGLGLIRHHAFVDGNKRAALLATGLFLYLNGYRLVTTQADATLTTLALAASELTEAEFAHWLRAHIQTRQA